MPPLALGLDVMTPTESDAYEIFTKRHGVGSIIATFADPLRAQSAIVHFTAMPTTS